MRALGFLLLVAAAFMANDRQQKRIVTVSTSGGRPVPSSAGGAAVAASNAVAVNRDDVSWMARTMWCEARGQGDAGLIAVGHVILTRATDRKKRWPRTIKGVCFQPWQFSCWNAGDPNGAKGRAVTIANRTFKRCLELAEGILAGRIANPMPGATHYANVAAVLPNASFWKWAPKMHELGKIGDHTFYRDP